METNLFQSIATNVGTFFTTAFTSISDFLETPAGQIGLTLMVVGVVAGVAVRFIKMR